MDPALLEGRFCILHETKYLPMFHFFKCRAETTVTKKKGERNTFYCLLNVSSPQRTEIYC